ncbi:MAG: FtsQ-type POTRA domain-containing protein [Candidatus Cybelea sp.]
MRVKERRRKRSPVARIRPFWMPIALASVLLLATVAVAATWPAFDPKEIIVSGNHRVGRNEILARAAIPSRVTIWLQNTGAIERRIETIPYIAQAAVHRGLPASIRIAVVERTPFAVVESGFDAAVVDHALRVLEPATAAAAGPVFMLDPGADLVPGSYLRTREAIELRNTYDAVAAAHMAATTLALDRYGGRVVTIRGGVKLLLGSSNDMERKLTLADAILSQVVRRERRVSAIDLRAPAAPVLVYRR